MKLFNSVAYDAIYGKFIYFLIICVALSFIPSLFLVFVGVVFVLGIFKTAMEIDEFQCRYGEMIKDFDETKNLTHLGKIIKINGKWL